MFGKIVQCSHISGLHWQLPSHIPQIVPYWLLFQMHPLHLIDKTHQHHVTCLSPVVCMLPCGMHYGNSAAWSKVVRLAYSHPWPPILHSLGVRRGDYWQPLLPPMTMLSKGGERLPPHREIVEYSSSRNRRMYLCMKSLESWLLVVGAAMYTF